MDELSFPLKSKLHQKIYARHTNFHDWNENQFPCADATCILLYELNGPNMTWVLNIASKFPPAIGCGSITNKNGSNGYL